MIEEVGLIEPLSTETWLVTACLVVGILPKFEITHANKPPASKELNLEAIWLYIYIALPSKGPISTPLDRFLNHLRNQKHSQYLHWTWCILVDLSLAQNPTATC